MTLDEFSERALIVPFVVGGRSYDGWDCWGLIYCAYRDVFNVTINNLSMDYDEKLSYVEITNLVDREKHGWKLVEKPAIGDVSLYRVGKYQSHVALVLPHGRMLHCERTAGTINERLDNRVWAGRNVGYFHRSN